MTRTQTAMPVALLFFTCVLLWTAALTAEPASDPEPPPHITVKVDGDRDIEVVMGPASSADSIVYLHGVCGDPLAFESWADAARHFATFISLRGDLACKSRPGRSKWSHNRKRLLARIDQALTAVSAKRRVALDPNKVVLIGYSQGASRVQMMAYSYPERFRRVALIAPPTQPSLGLLRKTERVLLMGGAWDARGHIKKAHLELKRAKRTVHYAELPKARHGQYGPAANDTMLQALGWLFLQNRAE